MTTTVDRVVLSWPTHLADVATAGGKATSWIQVAKIGSFVSARYGKFSITKHDLSQMLHNFETITPKAPTQLPVDYDHLSMDPQRPGDGVAAGWISKLELREDSNELWAEVEWTPDAATKIGKKEYQFVSPSFVKDYVYKDGKTIGTTLLAAAITNHPFLEGMAALTLSAGLTDLAMALEAPPPRDNGEVVEKVSMDIGQKVSVKDAAVQRPEHVGMPFEIVEVVGEGDDAFVALKSMDGTTWKYFRATDLEPARTAPPVVPVVPPVVPAVSAVPALSDREKTMSQMFKLRDAKGTEVELSAEDLEKAGIKVVPEGSVALPTAEVDKLKGEVKSLSDQVTTLATTAAEADKRARTVELKTELDRLSKGGFITKPERDWAEKSYGEATNLDTFKAWAATKIVKVVDLEKEHGSGHDEGQGGDAGKAATEKIMALAHKIAAERRISLAQAIVQASKQDPEAVAEYQEQFRPVEARV